MVLCAVSGVAMLLSFLSQSYDLNQALVTDQGMKTKKDGISDEERKVTDLQRREVKCAAQGEKRAGKRDAPAGWPGRGVG